MEGPRSKGFLPEAKTKVVVYTALFGEGDRLWSVPPIVVPGAKYVVFTERPRREVGLWTYNFSIERPAMLVGTDDVSPPSCLWEQRIVKAPHGSRKAARYHKVMAHKVLRGADVSIWVDANVRLLLLPSVALKRWMRQRDLVVFKHSQRNCLYDEVHACLQLGKGVKSLVTAQAQAYRKSGMPRGYGLATTRCLIRRHTPKIAKLNEAWWKEIQRYSLRDQISLPFVCWREKVLWDMIPRSVRKNQDFWFLRHRAVIGAYHD